MLSVGMVLGGPEHELFDKCVRELMRYCRENRHLGFADAEVNVVFHVPGSLKKPDYIGVRTGKFSAKERCQMIQAAVEEEFAGASSRSEIRQYIFDVVDESIGLAKTALERKGIPYPLEVDRSFLDTWLDREA